MNTEEQVYEQAVRNYFKGDRYVIHSGITIDEITAERTIVSAQINETHLNGNGCVQGGMLYTMADFAFAVHENYLHPGTVTQGGQITYLRPAFCKKIVATATETERAGHNTVAEVILTGEDGKILCICHFNGFVKEMDKLSFIEKYAKDRSENLK